MTTIAEVRQPGSVSRTGGLIVEGLTTELSRRGQSFKIVDGVSFQISPGQIVGLVGETGCGKTMTALEHPPAFASVGKGERRDGAPGRPGPARTVAR